MRDSLPRRPNFHCAAAISITPARSSSPACGRTPSDPQLLCLLADLDFENVARVTFQLASRAGAQEHRLRIERSGAAGHRSGERCERRLQLTRAEGVDAEQRERAAAVRQLAFHFHHRTRDRYAGNRGDARIQILVQARSALDRQVGEPVQAARSERYLVGSGAIDQIDREAERHTERDRNDQQRVAAGRAAQRSDECGIDERPRLHGQTAARSCSPCCVRR